MRTDSQNLFLWFKVQQLMELLLETGLLLTTPFAMWLDTQEQLKIAYSRAQQATGYLVFGAVQPVSLTMKDGSPLRQARVI
jgi:hypothetical protein